MISADSLREEIEARAIIDAYIDSCSRNHGGSFPDGTEVCKGITYRVRDGEGYYVVDQEFRDHVRSIVEGDDK